MKNIQLSQNFSLAELTKSNTAIRKGIDNTPDKWQLNNLINLTYYVLQPTRDGLGMRIIVSSGFRCDLLNKIIGGSPTSDHRNGMAADIELENGDNAMLFNFIKDNLEFDQLIWEFGDDNQPKWVHVSFRTKATNRNQVLRSYRENGHVNYVKI